MINKLLNNKTRRVSTRICEYLDRMCFASNAEMRIQLHCVIFQNRIMKINLPLKRQRIVCEMPNNNSDHSLDESCSIPRITGVQIVYRTSISANIAPDFWSN